MFSTSSPFTYRHNDCDRKDPEGGGIDSNFGGFCDRIIYAGEQATRQECETKVRRECLKQRQDSELLVMDFDLPPSSSMLEIFARLRGSSRSFCANQPQSELTLSYFELLLSCVLNKELRSRPVLAMWSELNGFPRPCLAFCVCSYCHQWIGFHTIGFCLFNHFNYTIDINRRNYPQK